MTGPSNLAGPWAWAANAVGSGIAGYGGYVAGGKFTEYVYDLVIDPEPLSVDLR